MEVPFESVENPLRNFQSFRAMQEIIAETEFDSETGPSIKYEFILPSKCLR